VTCSIRLSPSAPSCSDLQAPSPCVSPHSQAADEGLDRQRVTSSRRSQSKTSDVRLPGETNAQHGMIQLPLGPDSVQLSASSL